MPNDLTVALGVQPAQSTLVNPIEMASSLTSMQKNLVDLQTVRQTLAAKQKAGALMAGAPDLDSGIHAIMQDPQVSGFAPDIVSTLQAVSNAQTAQAGERQTQATSGLNAVMDGLLPALNDPSTFDQNVEARMQTLSPSAQAAVRAAMPHLKAALFDGLPQGSPEAATTEYQRRLAAMMVGAGFGPDGIRAATGTMAPTFTTVKGPQGQDITLQVGGPMTGGAGGALGPGGVLNVGPTPDIPTRLAGEGELTAGIEKDMSNASSNLPNLISTIDQTVQAMSAMQPGGGADIRAGLGKALQFFKNAGAEGISDDLINKVSNGNLAATQTLQAMLRNFVTGQLRIASEGTGAGRIKSEVDAFLQSADATTDPQALLNIFKAALQHLQIDYDQAQAWPDFKKKALGDPNSTEAQYGLPGFYSWYNAHRLNLKTLPILTPSGQDLTTPSTSTRTGNGSKSLKEIFGE